MFIAALEIFVYLSIVRVVPGVFPKLQNRVLCKIQFSSPEKCYGRKSSQFLPRNMSFFVAGRAVVKEALRDASIGCDCCYARLLPIIYTPAISDISPLRYGVSLRLQPKKPYSRRKVIIFQNEPS